MAATRKHNNKKGMTMNDSVHCKFKNARPSRKTVGGATPLLAAALFTAAPFAGAATYDASTGYVTLLNGGAYGSDSPLTTNKVSKTNSATSVLIDAWSDGLAPHSNTNYYAAKQFRTPPHSAGAVEFQGGRLVVNTVVQWKGFGDSTLTFPEGLEVAGGTLRCNESASRANARARIYGPVAFTGNCTVNPSGGDTLAECGLNFHGEASSPADVTVTVKQQQSPRWGWFGLLGGTDGFFGTIAVESCGYEMGTNGLPNGSVSFTGTNNILRLVANEAAMAPVVKNLAFASTGPHEIRIEVDGDADGKINVTNSFSAAVPVSVTVSGTLSGTGNVRRFEFLRAPKGMLSMGDFALPARISGDYRLSLAVEEDGDEQVAVVEARKYVSLSNGGADGESPLNSATVTASESAVNAWSDGNAPTDPTLGYYAYNRSFRTPRTTTDDFEFAGGTFYLQRSTMWPKTFSPAVLRFPRGFEMMNEGIVQINENGLRVVAIDGPVTFSGTSTVNPARGANVGESRVAFLGAATSEASAEIVVKPSQGDYRGFFSLAGNNDGFFGTITVTNCSYAMGAQGLPNGILSFAGSGDVLRLPALSGAAAVPCVKTLSFGDGGAATLEVACDGASCGKLRVTGAFSAAVPLRVVLSGKPAPEAARLEILRAPAGQFALADFAPAQTRIGSLDLEWQVVGDGGESVLVAKVFPSCTVLTIR